MEAISLFSGAGGDSIGIKHAGINVVAFSEFNKDAIKTHLAAFPESKLLGSTVKGDITKIPDSEFENFKNIKLVFAGFPCQGFSNAGKKDVNDPRNKLFYEFLRVVRIVKPEWIMGENVSGLLTRKTDDGQHKVIDVIKKEFEDVGYSLSCKIYDVSDVGVPQARKRLLLIGNRLNIKFEMPVFTLPKQGIRGIIEETLDGAIETSLEPPPQCIFKIQKELEITGSPHSYLCLKHPDLISFGKRISPHHSEILDLNSPCKTIICAYTFQPRLYVCIQTPTKKYVRCLTNNELAQIQSFPKDYPFKGSDSSIKKQIGNAVPSKIVEQLVKSILENQEQV